MSSPVYRSGFARVLILLALGAGSASAAGWSVYEAAFPAHPCADGWAACKAGGREIGPGMVKDAAGHPLAAHARLGWFDLKPTAAFSPFGGLSAYDGAIGGEVAAAPAPAAPAEPPPASSGGEAPPDRPAAPAGDAGGPASAPVAANTEAGSPARITPTAPPAPGMGAPPPTPMAGSSGGSSSAPVANTTATTAPASTARTTSTPTAVTAPPPGPTATAVVKVESGGDDCSDIVKLEPVSMMGTLTVGQSKCIEGRIASEGRQTERDKLSRVLINNAEAKGDKADWERLVKRHLEDIDRSDPDLCYKYALQLSRGGAGRAQGVIRWADYALENKQRWSGNTYKSRVYALYKLKAEAANKIWQDAENDYMTKEHTEANEAKAAKWRGTTKDFAREWLDYAKSSAQDTKNAMAICVSAAGSQSFCDG